MRRTHFVLRGVMHSVDVVSGVGSIPILIDVLVDDTGVFAAHERRPIDDG